MRYAMLVTFIVGVSGQALAGQEWSLTGNLAETCCCQPACPCVFNSAPTLGHCEGNSLFEIEEGRYGDVSVDGLTALFTYRFGEWIRLYVDERATDEQMDAIARLLNQPNTFGGLFGGVELRSVERADISVARTPTSIAFSVPDAKVEMEVLAGPDGTPVRIENLSIPWFVNGYEQYKTVALTHERDGESFEYSGTNGATSRVEASGTVEDE